MQTYDGLDWESLEALKTHLYRRFATALHKGISVLEEAQTAQELALAREKFLHTYHTLQAALNTINAWASLIHYKKRGALDHFYFKPLTADMLPAWWKKHLEQQASLRIEFEQPLSVHPESFLEGVLLMCQVACHFSHALQVQILDSNGPHQALGVYVRVVFSPEHEQGPLLNLAQVRAQFDPQQQAHWDSAMQLAAAQDFMLLNRASFTLQNNKQTGQQALAAFFPAHEKRSTLTVLLPAVSLPEEGPSPLGHDPGLNLKGESAAS
jgi:hypothetical protein